MSRRCCFSAAINRNVDYLLSLQQQRRDDVVVEIERLQQRWDIVAVTRDRLESE
jgi:hypothetical protein